MAIPLTNEDVEEILSEVQLLFPQFFDQSNIDRQSRKDYIREVINDSTLNEIKDRTFKKALKVYGSVAEFSDADLKILLCSTYVLILARGPAKQVIMSKEVDEFLHKYPSFAHVTKAELALLLKFWKYMLVALTVLPARLNKKILRDICGRLEGTQRPYITGGINSGQVERRVIIYETEGEIKAEIRDARYTDIERPSPEEKQTQKKARLNKQLDVIRPGAALPAAIPFQLLPDMVASHVSSDAVLDHPMHALVDAGDAHTDSGSASTSSGMSDCLLCDFSDFELGFDFDSDSDSPF